MDPLITRGGTVPVTNLEIELMGALLSGNMPDWYQEFLDSCESSLGQTEGAEGTLDPEAQDQNTASTSSDVSAGGNTPSSPFLTIPNAVPLQAVDAQLNHTDSGNGEAPHSTSPDDTLPPNNTPNDRKRRLSDPEVPVQPKRARHLHEDTDLRGQVGQGAAGPSSLGSGIVYPPEPSQFFFHPPPVLPPRYFPGAPPADPVASSSASAPAPFMMPQAMHNPAYYPPLTFGAPLHAGGFSVLTPYGDGLQGATPAPYPFPAPEQTQQIMGVNTAPAAYASAPAPVMMIPQPMFNAYNPAYYQPQAPTFVAPLHAGGFSVLTPYGDGLQTATPALNPFAAPEQKQQVMGVTDVPAAYASAPAPVMMIPQPMFNAYNSAYYQPPTLGAPLPAAGHSVLTPYGDALQNATPASAERAPVAAPAPFTAPEPFAAPEPSAAPEQEQRVTVTQADAPAPRKTRSYAIKPPGRGEVADSPDASRQRIIEAHRANDARARDTDDITCLWTEPGAQPCYLVCRGTDALLAHCVAQHGVCHAKDRKEMTRCGWADCALPDIMMGGLKRHLAESQLHARRGRFSKAKAESTAKTVKAEDAA